MNGCKLPDSEWVTLQEAVKFWWSDCFPSLPAPLAMDDLNPPHATPGGGNDCVAFVPDHKVQYAAFDFDRKLTEAAFAQRVRFKGKREDNDASQHEPIDFGYFSKSRGFCLGDGEIQPMPYSINDQDIFEHAVTDRIAVWHDVLVRRDDFVTWVGEAYASRASRRSKAGTKAKWDWCDIEMFVHKQLDDNDDFNNPIHQVPGWKGQNDLIKRVKDYIVERLRLPEPSHTTLKERIKPMVERWRAVRAEMDGN